MTIQKEEIPETTSETQNWEDQLERVGFVRRIFLARRWYGADWWFVAISTVMVVAFIIIALFPGWFAPYQPDQIVGPRFLAPGEHPEVAVLIVPVDSSLNVLEDLAVPAGEPRPPVGVVQGVPTGGALNERAKAIDDEIKNEPEGLRLRPRINRYPTIEEALQAVADGDDLGIGCRE